MTTLNLPRSAPKDHLWANVEDWNPHGSFVMSQECALDMLDPDWHKYPSWPNYPDERNLPIGIADRAAWALRKPLRLAELARLHADKPTKPIRTEIPNKVTKDSEQVCAGCGKAMPASPTKPRKFHNDACRMKANRKH